MNKKTLTARKTCVKKYESALAGKPIQLGMHGCALCKLYAIGKLPECLGCPVSAATNQRLCAGTPYAGVSSNCSFSHTRGACCYYVFKTRVARAAIRAEIKFLKSFLPKARGVK